MSRCEECGRKPRQPDTPAATDAKTRLWLMEHGWSVAIQRVTRAAYCNTCGVKIDRRRSYYK